MTDLFSSYQLKDVTLKNRIAIPPMCQYMAEDGLVNDWHKVHYTSLARGGSGLVIVEATAVAPEGRITPNCLGIWNDDQADQLREIASASMMAAPRACSIFPTVLLPLPMPPVKPMRCGVGRRVMVSSLCTKSPAHPKRNQVDTQ